MSKIITKITSPLISGNYSQWKKSTLNYVELFNDKVGHIIDRLDLPKTIELRVRAIPYRMKASGIAYPPECKGGKYIVDVDARQSRCSFFHTLLHELVHVEQYYTDKLIIGEYKILWKGKPYVQVHNVHSAAYAKQPWEIEANLKAIKLYKLLKA
jgi:hypothetical protein